MTKRHITASQRLLMALDDPLRVPFPDAAGAGEGVQPSPALNDALAFWMEGAADYNDPAAWVSAPVSVQVMERLRVSDTRQINDDWKRFLRTKGEEI